MSYSKVMLIGTLIRNPEMRMVGSGTVTGFTIEVNDTWIDKSGEERERTPSLIDCEAWGSQGEAIARDFTKDKRILVEGYLRQDTWEDKETGKKRSTLRVVVQSFDFANDGEDDNAESKDTDSTGPSEDFDEMAKPVSPEELDDMYK
jgi:single-strand DNA-binding protein